jgi:hypothetical protein
MGNEFCTEQAVQDDLVMKNGYKAFFKEHEAKPEFKAEIDLIVQLAYNIPHSSSTVWMIAASVIPPAITKIFLRLGLLKMSEIMREIQQEQQAERN